MTPERILGELIQRHHARSAEFDLGADDGRDWLFDELADAWRGAQADATAAYEHWCDMPSADAFVVYRAAQDRADQAQAALAERDRRRRYPESVATARGQGSSSAPAAGSQAGSDPAGGGGLLRP